MMPAAYSFREELISKSQSENITMQSKSKKYDAHSLKQIGHKPRTPSRGNRLLTMFNCPPPPLPSINLPGIIELKKGWQYREFNRVYIKSTNHSAKVLVARLVILQITLCNMFYTPHSAETYGHHWRQDNCSTANMAACTFPCQVHSQIAR